MAQDEPIFNYDNGHQVVASSTPAVAPRLRRRHRRRPFVVECQPSPTVVARRRGMPQPAARLRQASSDVTSPPQLAAAACRTSTLVATARSLDVVDGIRRMDSANDDGTTQGTHTTQSSNTTSKTRGATRMQKIFLQRSTLGKQQIELDGLEPVFGPAGSAFKSYVALVGRINTPITIDEWPNVPEKTKATIWKDILSTYDIPDTIDMRKYWINYVGDRWKDFKTKLVSKYIYGSFAGQNPCKKYDFLEQETWNEFFQQHTGPAYEAKRKKYQDIQAKNIHPHLLARGGYKRLEKMMMDEKLKEKQACADNADPSYTMTPPSPPRRAQKWKKARMDKSGNFRTESTKLVAEKIDALELQFSQGEFVEDGRQDSLTVALGTDEHCGRVRAMGRGHGIKSVFGHAKRSQKPSEDVQRLIDVAVDAAVTQGLEKQNQQYVSEQEELIQRLTLQFEARVTKMMLQFGSLRTPVQTPVHPSVQSKQGNDVCVDAGPQSRSDKASSSDPFANLPALGARCQLFLEDPIRRLVAYGTAYSGGQVHGVILDVNQVKVSIDEVRDPSAHVPIPTSEVQLVGDAIQHFIIWPKKLVELCTEANVLKEKTKLTFQSGAQSVADPDSLTIVCKKAFAIASRLEHNLMIHVARGIMGNIEYDLHLESVEIMRFLNMETIDVSLFQFFIRGIYISFELASKDTYGFLDPYWTQQTMNSTDEKKSYINATMQYGKKFVYLAPYVVNEHWMLMAICPRLNKIYWFDSLGYGPREDIKHIMDTCMIATSMLNGKKQNRPPKWTTCSCAIQKETTECGYYVMKFMLEIVSNNLGKGMDKTLERQGRLPYNKQEIDEVRDKWSNFLIDEWVNKMLLS